MYLHIYIYIHEHIYIYICILGPGPGLGIYILGPGPGPVRTVLRTYLPYGTAYVYAGNLSITLRHPICACLQELVTYVLLRASYLQLPVTYLHVSLIYLDLFPMYQGTHCMQCPHCRLTSEQYTQSKERTHCIHCKRCNVHSAYMLYLACHVCIAHILHYVQNASKHVLT